MALRGLLEKASVLNKYLYIKFREQNVQLLVSGLLDKIVLSFCNKSYSKIYKQLINKHLRLAY